MDIVVAIDGQKVTPEEVVGASDKIRGKEGTEIKITIPFGAS